VLCVWEEDEMKIGLHDADNTGFPNLALMKLSAWHKAKGDDVEMFFPLAWSSYDHIYSSKVFTFTTVEKPFGDAEFGGTGYKMNGCLPDEVEHSCPDYSLYGKDFSQGFLTRGCPNKCGWCVVPSKEGDIRGHAEIEEFARHKNVVLMDNNVLASDHGMKQIEKMSKMGIRIDFNQGLDARRIDIITAKLLASCKWYKPIRLACDHIGMIPHVRKAVENLRSAGAKPKEYSCYVLVKEIPSALERVEFLRSMGVAPFAQPYRNFETNEEPSAELKRFARWVNHKAVFKSVKWIDYVCGKKWGEKC